MKCKYLFLFISAFVLASCGMDYDAANEEIHQQSVKYNVEQKLGITIDPEQTWSSIVAGSITIKADADMSDFVKVQILTESPFFNEEATVLNEIAAQNGDVVTLSYEAPNVYTRLIAACVNSNGYYYVKGFNIGESQVSFASNKATTRALTRADGFDASLLRLRYTDSEASINALRTIKANEAASGDETLMAEVKNGGIDIWQGEKWENERLWKLANDNVTLGDWTIDTGRRQLQRHIGSIDPDEAKMLNDIFTRFLGRNVTGSKKQDNMNSVRNSGVISSTNNHLTSDGTHPITVIPVLTASLDYSQCQLYYYYYNPSAIPSNMSELDYLKAIPKFKAFDCSHASSGKSDEFFHSYEYMLPFYGDPNELMAATKEQKVMCSTDDQLYRFRNGQRLNNEDYYLSYVGATDKNSSKLATKYDDNADNVANQLWQIFKDPDGKVILYNVGAGRYLCPDGDYATIYSNDEEKAKKNAYTLEDTGNGFFHIWKNDSKCIGTDLGVKTGNRVSTDKELKDGDRVKWYMEKYEGNKAISKKDGLVYNTVKFEKTAVSTIIPAGYRVGFMLRKNGSANVYAVNNGCLYGVGSMNAQINNFGSFHNAVANYSMSINDPRIAMFGVNGKTYLTFEDGTDCNFSDLIIEIGGTTKLPKSNDITEAPNPASTSGIVSIEQPQEPEAAAYTMCFEDRPIMADYDMNDVVLQATRIDNTTIMISLIACGAQDEVHLHNTLTINLEDRDIHDIFKVSGDQPYVNTKSDGFSREPMSESVYIGNKSIEEYLSGIYIENKTTGEIIGLPKKGEAPNAIIVPLNFSYPMEGQSIKDAYPEFLEWAQDKNTNKDWYTLGEADKIFPNLFNK